MDELSEAELENKKVIVKVDDIKSAITMFFRKYMDGNNIKTK